MFYYQQGDVLIKKVKTLPLELKLKKDNVVAEGEATGHKHQLTGDVRVFEKGGNMYIEVGEETATIVHEEHKPITIAPGYYEIGIVQEYDHFAEEARQVRD